MYSGFGKLVPQIILFQGTNCIWESRSIRNSRVSYVIQRVLNNIRDCQVNDLGGEDRKSKPSTFNSRKMLSNSVNFSYRSAAGQQQIIILQGCAVDPASPTNEDVGGTIPTSDDLRETIPTSEDIEEAILKGIAESEFTSYKWVREVEVIAIGRSYTISSMVGEYTYWPVKVYLIGDERKQEERVEVCLDEFGEWKVASLL